MIWNPSNAYSRIKDEIAAQGLVGSTFQRASLPNRLKTGQDIFYHQNIIHSHTIYTACYIPTTSKDPNGVIVFGIEYYNLPHGNRNPFIVVQYESNKMPLMIVYLDLHGDRVAVVAVSESAGDLQKSLDLKGKSLEESVKILFASIKKRVA